tara:strand:+ start:5239 stop:5688 length:450 start_codon:yes stop_codon:yes gene_type:complete
MNAVTTKWLEELESGNYTQVTGTLRQGEYGRCCLGVLCDVSEEGSWEDAASSASFRDPVMAYKTPRVPDYEDAADFELSTGIAAESTFEKTGIPRDHNGHDVQGMIATLNDSNRYSFKEMAELIRGGVEAIWEAYEENENFEQTGKETK